MTNFTWGNPAKKYRNKITYLDGVKFDSRVEARRFADLQLLEKAGKIRDLQRQVRYPLHGKNGGLIATYTVDYTYYEGARFVAEDLKGVVTQQFRLRQKLFEDNYPEIELRINSKLRKKKKRTMPKPIERLP